MTRVCSNRSDIDLLWRLRFGAPLVTTPELTLRILDAYSDAPPARLCVEAAALEQDAQRARAELRSVRDRSRRLVEEARALAGLRV